MSVPAARMVTRGRSSAGPRAHPPVRQRADHRCIVGAVRDDGVAAQVPRRQPPPRSACSATSSVVLLNSCRPRSVSIAMQVMQGLDAGRGDHVDAFVRPARFELGDPWRRPTCGRTRRYTSRVSTDMPCATKVSCNSSRPPSPRTISTRAPLASCKCGCASNASLVKPASGTMSAAQLGGCQRCGRRPADRCDARASALLDRADAVRDRIDADEHDQVVVDRRDRGCAATRLDLDGGEGDRAAALALDLFAQHRALRQPVA